MDLRNLSALHQSATLASHAGARPPAGANTAAGAPGASAAGSPPPPPANALSAYLELLKALAGDGSHAKSADMLTAGLRNAASTLRSAYDLAAAKLSPQLVSKDWGFSVGDGKLIFIQRGDELLAPELTQLHTAFGNTDAESAAKQLAAVIVSIAQLRRTGADSGSLAWIRFDVDDASFGNTVDLRSYVTANAPGSLYHPGAAYPPGQHPVPPLLGGMDLRDLVTARPRFLRDDGTVSPDALTDFDGPAPVAQAGTLHGQCACGQVRFIAQDDFEYAFYCHCARCRARTGSAFAAIAAIAVDKMEVVAGHEHLLLEGECSDGYGARCNRCFSFLFAAVRGRQYLHVSLGVLKEAPARLPDHHIHVGSKAPWYNITDALPQYDELP